MGIHVMSKQHYELLSVCETTVKIKEIQRGVSAWYYVNAKVKTELS